jgi:hypothetical protein
MFLEIVIGTNVILENMFIEIFTSLSDPFFHSKKRKLKSGKRKGEITLRSSKHGPT